MKVILNTCQKPALFKHNSGVTQNPTLFKGNKPEVELKCQVKHDTVEISNKPAEKPEPKCEGGNCK